MTLNEIMNMKNYDDIMLKPLNDREWRIFIDNLLTADEIYLQYGEEVSAELLKTIQKKVPGIIYYSVYSQEPHKMVGYIAVAPDDRDYLEFHIFKEYRNKGYGTRAITEFIDLFFSGELTGRKGKELVAELLPENTEAFHLLKKLGFTEEAEKREATATTAEMIRLVLKRK